MKKIKAIETSYNGYRFRSRLEARWAIYFDAAGIEWEYEPEGFEFEDGTRYLPDFRIKTGCNEWEYAEIKPSGFLRDADVKKLSTAMGSMTFFFLVGLPDVYAYPLLGEEFDPVPSHLRAEYIRKLHLYLSNRNKALGEFGDCNMFNWYQMFYYYGNWEDYRTQKGLFSMAMGWGDFDFDKREDASDYEDANHCVVIARSARFEYGEQG